MYKMFTPVRRVLPSTMKLPSHVVIIICTLLVQIFPLQRYLLVSTSKLVKIGIFCGQGLLFLVYPLLGHVADVWLTKYHMLRCALVFRWIGAAGLSLCLVTTVVVTVYEAFATFPYSNGIFKYSYSDVTFLLPLAIVFVTVCILSGGIFEANAIQFGLDQLLEAPTPKLINFIHWYYWSHNVGGLALFYYVLGFLFFMLYITPASSSILDGMKMFILYLVLTFVAGLTAIFFFVHSQSFYIQRAGLNPFKNIMGSR